MNVKNRLIHQWKIGPDTFRIAGPGLDVRGGSFIIEQMEKDALGGEKWSQISSIASEGECFVERILIEAIEQFVKWKESGALRGPGFPGE